MVASTMFGKTKRQWTGLLYPRRVRLFDILNTNADFQQFIRTRLKQVSHFDNRDQLYQHVNQAVLKGEAIDYLEFGVWQGASIKRWCELNSNPKSRFFGFDSFEGLPEYWNRKTVKGAFDLQGVAPQIGDERVKLVKGWFQESVPTFLESFHPQSRLVIHIDSDLYSSALFCLTSLHPLAKPGTILIFDQFQDSEHEFSAFVDYTTSYYREWVVLGTTKRYLQVAIEMTK
jgi:O-methyltransferase